MIDQFLIGLATSGVDFSRADMATALREVGVEMSDGAVDRWIARMKTAGTWPTPT